MGISGNELILDVRMQENRIKRMEKEGIFNRDRPQVREGADPCSFFLLHSS